MDVADASPLEAVFEALAGYQAVTLPTHRLVYAAAFYEQLAPALAELRAVSFPFLEDVPEPATADRWIERGGKSWQTLPI